MMMDNQKLRKARQQKRWSIEKAAEKVGISWLTFSRWEHGTQRPRPATLDMLCTAFGMSPEELGYVAENCLPRTDVEIDPESREDVKRREALQKIVQTTGTTLMLSDILGLSSLTSNNAQPFFKSSISEETIIGLATITQQHRILQRSGVTILQEGLHGHITTIQNALDGTLSETIRRELWRLLAQAQLVARLHVNKKQELGRAKTWNMAAITSAQHSGDTLLVGATIGHLAHLYLTQENDIQTAYQLIDKARELAQGHAALHGWFSMVTASIAAKAGNAHQCKNSIAFATERAAGLTPEDTDAFFTDFNTVSVDAFAGNCLFGIGEPKGAYKRLTGMHVQALSENRQASTLYDLSRAYAGAGELEAMQASAFQSIEKALVTNRLYIVPRFIKLAQEIQRKDRHESHACAIGEYARVALCQS
ncbi:MAG TPA: helix-turn-helix transcriptional regulator [Ktedonobacteraceae bacterium]